MPTVPVYHDPNCTDAELVSLCAALKDAVAAGVGEAWGPEEVYVLFSTSYHNDIGRFDALVVVELNETEARRERGVEAIMEAILARLGADPRCILSIDMAVELRDRAWGMIRAK